MIFNYIYTFPNGTGGLDQTVINTSASISNFVPFLLLFIWLFVFVGGIMRQKARIGVADYPAWATTASLATFISAILMTLVEGFIRLEWLIVVFVIAVFSGVWLFLDKKPSEV